MALPLESHQSKDRRPQGLRHGCTEAWFRFAPHNGSSLTASLWHRKEKPNRTARHLRHPALSVPQGSPAHHPFDRPLPLQPHHTPGPSKPASQRADRRCVPMRAPQRPWKVPPDQEDPLRNGDLLQPEPDGALPFLPHGWKTPQHLFVTRLKLLSLGLRPPETPEIHRLCKANPGKTILTRLQITESGSLSGIGFMKNKIIVLCLFSGQLEVMNSLRQVLLGQIQLSTNQVVQVRKVIRRIARSPSQLFFNTFCLFEPSLLLRGLPRPAWRAKRPPQRRNRPES